MSETKALALINKEVSKELADPHIVKALLATTFKSFTPDLMKQAIFEGIVRGFSFKNFLQKDVYAIKYGEAYNLVTSIDLARKIGNRGGVSGKSKPTFEEKGDKIISCDVTVYKKGGDDRGYTATVYFDEYYKAGKNGYPSLWDSKPRTMIAKVAEMHALRMACPEAMAKIYTAEEFDKEKEEFDTDGIDDNTVPVVHVGEDHGMPKANLTVDRASTKEVDDLDQYSDVGLKNLIYGLCAGKWKDLDLKDAKAVKTAIADYTELEFVPTNYKAIAKKMR